MAEGKVKRMAKIRDFSEFLTLWGRSKNIEVLDRLIHIGLTEQIIPPPYRDSRHKEYFHEAIDFYIGIVKWVDEYSAKDDYHYMLGKEAYEALVSSFRRLVFDITRYLDVDITGETKSTFEKLLKFFIEAPFPNYFGGGTPNLGWMIRKSLQEPSRRELESFLAELWFGANMDGSPLRSIKSFLNTKKKEIIQALVTVGMFDFIIKHKIMEAIPNIQHDIFLQIDYARNKVPNLFIKIAEYVGLHISLKPDLENFIKKELSDVSSATFKMLWVFINENLIDEREVVTLGRLLCRLPD